MGGAPAAEQTAAAPTLVSCAIFLHMRACERAELPAQDPCACFVVRRPPAPAPRAHLEVGRQLTCRHAAGLHGLQRWLRQQRGPAGRRSEMEGHVRMQQVGRGQALEPASHASVATTPGMRGLARWSCVG